MQGTTNLYRKITLILIFSFFYFAKGQSVSKLKVGDTLSPELIEVIKDNVEDINKPTIINFWATWCVPCIRELKVLNSILEENVDINILSVTYENEDIASRFVSKDSGSDFHNLTVLSGDTLFIKFFPHKLLPHNIWIDGKGIIQQITGGEEMTRENVFSFISGRELKMSQKIDILDFKPYEPFRHSDSEYKYRSILTKRVEGLPSGGASIAVGYADKTMMERVFFFNSTLEQMLWSAVNLNKSMENYFNTMRIETADSLRFFSTGRAPESFAKSKYESIDEWRLDHTHCFELNLPEAVKDTLFYTYMLDDLKRNFNFDIEVVEDSVVCSVLTRDNSIPLTYNQVDSTLLRFKDNELIVENVDVLSLYQYMNDRLRPGLNVMPEDPPFIDRTGGVRLSFVLKLKEGVPRYKYVKEYIEKEFGIKVHHEEVKYDITVIRDLNL